MTTMAVDRLITALRDWPSDDVAELLDVARVIEGPRKGVYEMSPEERSAVNEGLAEARRGDLLSDAQMDAVWARLGA